MPTGDLEGTELDTGVVQDVLELNPSASPRESSAGVVDEGHTDDPLGIGQLSRNFEQLVEKINERVRLLSSQVLQSVEGEQYAIGKSQIQASDNEIKRLKQLITQCDEFELDFLKIGQIADIAKEFKLRILALEKAIQ